MLLLFKRGCSVIYLIKKQAASDLVGAIHVVVLSFELKQIADADCLEIMKLLFDSTASTRGNQTTRETAEL